MPPKVTTNNIPEQYKSAELNKYVQNLSTPQPVNVPAPRTQVPTTPIAASTITNPQQPVQLPNVDPTATINTANQIASSTQSKVDADILNATQEAEALQKAGGTAADTARTGLLNSVKSLLTTASLFGYSRSTILSNISIY